MFSNSHKIRLIECPLLVMHGEEDLLIHPQEAQLNYENAGSKHKVLEILEGVGHNDMMMACDNAYFESLTRFFKEIFI